MGGSAGRAAIASLTLAASLALVGMLGQPAGAAPPTDPQAGAQQPLRIMKVGRAVEIAGELRNVRVFVPDTGLDLDHPDLRSTLFRLPRAVRAPNPDGVSNPGTVPAGAPGWDVIGTNAPSPLDPDPDPSDPPGGSGHGTLVSGLLGAAWDNGVGGAGVAPNARFVVLRTCWDGDQCYQYVQAAAFKWAADRRVRVVSMSWLVGRPEAGFIRAIRQADRTLFVAIPSGNEPGGNIDGDNTRAPCTIDLANILCVTTSSPNDRRSCTAIGPRSVDVAVPVENSVTTVNGGGFTGTGCAASWAAPTAAGVAAILFGAEPGAGPIQVKRAIIDSAREVPAFRNKVRADGIVNAAAAVRLLQNRLRASR